MRRLYSLLALSLSLSLAACMPQEAYTLESQTHTVGAQTATVTRIGNQTCITRIDANLGTVSTRCD